jgi:Dyp-type peroxidase family
MAKFRVLSLDGGGVRGLFTALLIERLCREPGLEHAFDHIDLIAGNSSGALIALAMARWMGQPEQLETVIGAFDKPEDVFGRPRWPRPFDFIPWVFLTKYRGETREAAVKEYLPPDLRLRDLKTHVLITTFDLDNEGLSSVRMPVPRMWKPKILHNFIGPNSDRDTFAWQAALYSTAAVTYFPAVDGFVDGGVYANNPSMCALAQIFDARYEPKPKPGLDEVLMLSIGAGQNLAYVPHTPTPRRKLRWGLVEWAWKGRFVTLATDATVGVADYECRQLLSDSNYRRLNPPFDTADPIPLDDFGRVQYFHDRIAGAAVQKEIDDCVNWLKEHWMPGLPTGPLLTEAKSKHVGMATELTCVMPIKQGFLPVLDTFTFATRLHAVFKVLQTLRTVAREQTSIRPVLDIVDAARTVHSFSWAILLERNLLLQVTFDRPWEPYIRVIWKDLGPLLDLFLCNCEGFVPSSEGFDAFADFVRSHQAPADFFYPSSSLTVDDQNYLVELERLQRSGGTMREAASLVPPGPIARTREASEHNTGEAVRQWMAVLQAMYDLTMFYPQGSADHVYLHNAARVLLAGSRPQGKLPQSPALTWLDTRDAVVPPGPAERRKLDPRHVQGGIQKPYRRISLGHMFFLRIENDALARTFVGQLAGEVTKGSGHPDSGRDAVPDEIYTNVAFTCQGLKQIGVRDSLLDRFPKEFREGMENRAGLLGDVQQNHPENWNLPLLRGSSNGHTGLRVAMSTVDLVITLNKVAGANDSERLPEDHGWNEALRKMAERLQRHGLRVLWEEPLRRRRPDNRPESRRLTRDHFGFIDGISQPEATDVPDRAKRDEVELGEIFVGFQNQRHDPPFPPPRDGVAIDDGVSPWVQGSLIDAGSFLVVRKLRQHRKALDDVLGEAERQTQVPGEDLLAKMVGRTRDGVPLALDDHGGKITALTNDFTFGSDQGQRCPFHAHIRRGNPRLAPPPAGQIQPAVPRLARRSLIYGPEYTGDDDADRGVMFMAYNASIAEQFEVLQRWMTAGNTPAAHGNTPVYSGQPDPLMGLPDDDGKRIYRFVDAHGTPHHIDLGAQPFVTLQWGLYLFAPSIFALESLAKAPVTDRAFGVAAVSLGEQVIRQLKTVDDWAAAMEDYSMNQSGVTDAVLTAIRQEHDGILSTPYGVIVAREDLATEVLKGDPVFSVREYQNRFAETVGESYLGMDRGREYEALSTPSNETLKAVTEQRAFIEAHQTMALELQRAVRMALETDSALHQAAAGVAAGAGNRQVGSPDDRWLTVPLEPVIEYVLGELAQAWFDLPDGHLIRLGGRPASPDSTDVHCPFSFLAPSRYVFSSPNPRDAVIEQGQNNGQRLLDQARRFVQQRRECEQATGTTGLKGPISQALFKAIRDDDDRLARTLLGLVFGFVPTVYGVAMKTLALWLGDDTLARVQQHVLSAPREQDPLTAAKRLLGPALARAMMTKPVPPLLYRMVTRPTKLGGLSLSDKDRVVISIAGVTGELLNEQQKINIMPIFGGDRKAKDHPLHACPGYDIAMGVLYGMLMSIIELGPMTATPALVTIRVPNPPPAALLTLRAPVYA